jgi:hypothetical protein
MCNSYIQDEGFFITCRYLLVPAVLKKKSTTRKNLLGTKSKP